MNTRRNFLTLSAVSVASLALPAAAASLPDPYLKPQESKPKSAAKPSAKQEVEVSPNEDLMREHGVLRRTLLIYDHCAGLIRGKKQFDPGVLNQSAQLIRHFVEDYHEKMEEDFVFPNAAKAKLASVVATLRHQHQLGRRLTDEVLSLSSAAAFADPANQAKLAATLAAFLRMYRPHAAWEDTIVFPAFHQVLTPHAYDEFGDKFEDREKQLFGEDGFEKAAEQVASLEKKLGIYGLEQFSPKIPGAA